MSVPVPSFLGDGRNLYGVERIPQFVSRRSSAEVLVATEGMPPLRERVRREMATGMLLAAEEVFAESGLAKAHVDDIARRAGVAVGTLYNYYGDRDALLAAVLGARVEELEVELQGVNRAHAASPVRRALLELTRAYLRFFLRRRTFVRILAEGELAQLKTAYPTSAAIPMQCWQSVRDAFGEVMDRGIRDGALRGAHADLDLWLFLGLLRGVVMRDLKGATPCRESDADRVLQVFFEGAVS